MDFNEYQEQTATTAIYPGAGLGNIVARSYTGLGLANEAGEVAGKIKKWLRDGIPFAEVRAQVKGELGDVMWYVARVADEFGLELDDVARSNLDKLQDRKVRGVLGGSGDSR